MQCYKVTHDTIFKVAGLVKSECEELEIRGIDVAKQENGSDCGIYAIANAYELCRSKDPSKIEWCVDQMRGHLITTSFPTKQCVRIPDPKPAVCSCTVFAGYQRVEDRRWCSAVPVIGGFTKNV